MAMATMAAAIALMISRDRSSPVFFFRLQRSGSLDVTDSALDRPGNQWRATNTRQHYVTARFQSENCYWNGNEDIGENERAIRVLRSRDVLCLKAGLT